MRKYKCEFLCAGGGISGLMAGIAAGKRGVDVIIADKADTRRSGSASNGNDHFHCYIPECHGEDMGRVYREIGASFDAGPWVDAELTAVWINRSFEVIRMWEEIGINMRPTGSWKFEGHGMPGQQLYNLKFDGVNQKRCLNEEAKRQGCRILNRVFIHDVLTDREGRITGAIGMDLNEEQPEMIVIQCKAVLLATGMVSRMYPSITPQYMFNTPCCPATTGDAQAMAYRAGAKLVNMDMLNGHAGPKYFARGGKGTWIGISTDIRGETFTPYNSKPSRATGDITADVWPTCYRDRLLKGKGPTFMNCTETSPEDLDYMLHTAMVSEGIDSITDYCEQYGIDLRRDMVEFSTYPIMMGQRGIEIDTNARTSIPGLYAAGNCTGNVNGSLSGAAVFGMVAGENAAEYVHTVPVTPIRDDTLIREREKLYRSLMSRINGAHWKEAASALQNIMNEYVSPVQQSEDMLKAGSIYMSQLKENSLKELACANSHELMRTIEVLNMMDLSEPIFLCSLNRRETRGPHIRADYDFTDITLNGMFQTIYRDAAGQPHMEYRRKR